LGSFDCSFELSEEATLLPDFTVAAELADGRGWFLEVAEGVGDRGQECLCSDFRGVVNVSAKHRARWTRNAARNFSLKPQDLARFWGEHLGANMLGLLHGNPSQVVNGKVIQHQPQVFIEAVGSRAIQVSRQAMGHQTQS
jgi:hypothetical protein